MQNYDQKMFILIQLIFFSNLQFQEQKVCCRVWALPDKLIPTGSSFESKLKFYWRKKFKFNWRKKLKFNWRKKFKFYWRKALVRSLDDLFIRYCLDDVPSRKSSRMNNIIFLYSVTLLFQFKYFDIAINGNIVSHLKMKTCL